MAALRVERGDTVVSVAAGGGRALSLLSAEADRVIAVDRRLDQVFNIELKAAAIDCLSYRQFREFVGVDASLERRAMYSELRSSLGLRCRRYWDSRLELVEEGVLYCGRLERALSGFNSLLRRVGFFRWPADLFRCETVEDQRGILARHLGTGRTASVCWSIFCSSPVAWLAMRDPSFLRSTEGPLGAYLLRRFLRYAERRLVRGSFFLHLIHAGRYNPSGPLPVFLEAEHYERIRKRLDRLEIRNGRIEDVLSQVGRRGVTKWSLSDISAWMVRSQFHRFLEELSLSVESGDRVCFRDFGVSHGLPWGLGDRIRVLEGLSEEIEADDTSVFFRIRVLEAK